VRTRGLGQGLEPVGDLAEALVAGRLGHPRIHVRVLVDLPGDGGLEVVRGVSDGQAGGRIAHHLQVFQEPVGMPGLALGRRAKHRRHVVVALHVRPLGEVEITAIGLRLAREGVLEIVLGLAAFECHTTCSSMMWFVDELE
jgi:hypothetical protein